MLQLILVTLLMMGSSPMASASEYAAARTQRKLVFHSFGFDAIADSPDIDVTDYRYGDSKAPGARMPDWVKRDVGKAGGTNTNGPMLVGSELYVQWRIRATGEILEDTVQLDGRLPKKMTDHEVYFVVGDRQLFIYVVSPEARPEDYPIIGPNKFQRQKVFQIYP